MSRFTAPPRAVRAPASFNWTYTKLGSYENCPKKYGHLYIIKDVKEDESPQLRAGNEAHAALARAIETGEPLQGSFEKYQHHVDRARKGPDDVKILVEQKLAINRNFTPTGFFDDDVWLRGVVDVAKVHEDVAVILDWKAGSPREDSVQLALFAALIFAHHAKVQKIRTEFVWLREDFATVEDFTREDMVELWSIILPRVEQMEASTKTMEFPPVENPLCKWCPVTKCSFNKKG